MADGPTFFGPEGVTKGNATPAPTPSPEPQPKPAPAPLPTLAPTPLPRTSNRKAWRNLAVFIVCVLALGAWLYKKPARKPYEMGEYAPLGPLEVRVMEFEPGPPDEKGVAHAWFLARFTIAGTEGVDLQQVTATLMDSEGRTYHAEPRNFTEPEILNPGLDKGRTWTFVRPEHAAITHAQFKLAGGATARIAVKPYREPLKLPAADKAKQREEVARILDSPSVKPAPASLAPLALLAALRKRLEDGKAAQDSEGLQTLRINGRMERWSFGPFQVPHKRGQQAETDSKTIVEVTIDRSGSKRLTSIDHQDARAIVTEIFKGLLDGRDAAAGVLAIDYAYQSKPDVLEFGQSDSGGASWPGEIYQVHAMLTTQHFTFRLTTLE